MKTKTNNPSLVLVSLLLINLGFGLVFFGTIFSGDYLISNAQEATQKVLVENKVRVNAPNDGKLDNNEAIVRDYIIKNPSLAIAKITLFTNIPTKIKLTQTQIEELQEYELTPGDSWKDDKLVINNPVEANKVITRYPYLAQYMIQQSPQNVVSNLIRTGGKELPQKLIVILLILFTLLFSLTSKLLSKK